MIKLFDEYKYFNINGFFNPMDISRQDPNEPFFYHNKKKYFQRKRQENLEEHDRRVRINIENRKREEKELYERQKPMILKYIDIIKNHDDEIIKTGYKNMISKNNTIIFAVLLKDGATIISTLDVRLNKCVSCSIRGEKIIFHKDDISNIDLDPYDEENWNDDDISIGENLGNLIIDYVSKREIIW